MRIFLDANILFSAAKSDGRYGQAFQGVTVLSPAMAASTLLE